MTGVRDVAEAAGVSVATVSRVLNDPAAVRPQTRARVVRAMRELQYVSRERLDVSAGVLVVVVRSLLDPLELELADAIVRHAASHDLSVVVAPSAAVPVADDPGVSGLIERGVAALVLLWCSEGGEEAWIDAEGLPVIVVGGSPVEGAAHVSVGEGEAARLAVEEARAAGHVSILAVVGPGQRGESALAGLRACGVEAVRAPAVSAQAASALLERLGAPATRPTALIVGTAALGAAAVAAARELGLDVPGDLSVVVLGSAAAVSTGSPPLTTVAYPLAEAARHAVDAAAALFGDPASATPRIELRPTLLRGASLAPPRARCRS
jgi:DNA-binding LacI/PurR family transcriptional regulator